MLWRSVSLWEAEVTIGYRLDMGDEITRLAEKAEVFRKGEGTAILIRLDKTVDELYGFGLTVDRSPIEISGQIVCVCGTEFPFKGQFYGHGGRDEWCPRCGQQVGILYRYGWSANSKHPRRLVALGRKAFMIALTWNNPSHPYQLRINDVTLSHPSPTYQGS
jgi:hypothetical protein